MVLSYWDRLYQGEVPRCVGDHGTLFGLWHVLSEVVAGSNVHGAWGTDWGQSLNSE